MQKTWFTRMAGIMVCMMLLLSYQISAAVSAEPKLIALTFDDGPSLDFTPKVLKILDDEDIKATFFLVGKWLPGKRALVQEMVKDGQQIGNHTFDHVKLTGLSADEIRSELNQTDNALTDITGQTSFLVRPPFGTRDCNMLTSIDAPVILWTLDPAAGKQVPGRKMARFVLSHAKDGDIILLHDTTQYNLDAVKPIIDGLKKKGFSFVTVDELFQRKGVTPENGIAYKRITGFEETMYEELPTGQNSVE